MSPASEITVTVSLRTWQSKPFFYAAKCLMAVAKACVACGMWLIECSIKVG
jgi:hypothetical protein